MQPADNPENFPAPSDDAGLEGFHWMDNNSPEEIINLDVIDAVNKIRVTINQLPQVNQFK